MSFGQFQIYILHAMWSIKIWNWSARKISPAVFLIFHEGGRKVPNVFRRCRNIYRWNQAKSFSFPAMLITRRNKKILFGCIGKFLKPSKYFWHFVLDPLILLPIVLNINIECLKDEKKIFRTRKFQVPVLLNMACRNSRSTWNLWYFPDRNSRSTWNDMDIQGLIKHYFEHAIIYFIIEGGGQD